MHGLRVQTQATTDLSYICEWSSLSTATANRKKLLGRGEGQNAGRRSRRALRRPRRYAAVHIRRNELEYKNVFVPASRIAEWIGPHLKYDEARGSI